MSRDYLEFENLKRAPLSHQVAEEIRRRIDDGDLAPNTLMPSERSLSESFAVSRVTVREATQLLQAQNYLNVVHGKGSYVVEPAIRQESSLNNWMSGRQESLKMMVELRQLVEPAIAALAAEHITPAQTERLFELARRLEQEPTQTVSAVDALFHREIATCTGNTLVGELLDMCLARTEQLRLRTLGNKDGQKLAAAGHMAIARAIASGDAEASRKAMEAHMDDALNSI